MEDRSSAGQGPASLPCRFDRTRICKSRILCSLPRTYTLLGWFKISEMSYRVVENTHQLFSGIYAAGTVHGAEQGGKIPHIFRDRQVHGKKSLRSLSSCHQIIRKNAVLAVEHILVKRGPQHCYSKYHTCTLHLQNIPRKLIETRRSRLCTSIASLSTRNDS